MVPSRLAKKARSGRSSTEYGVTGEIVPKAAITVSRAGDLSEDVLHNRNNAMLLLAHPLLTAAGFEYDEIEETWVARMPLRPLVAVECDEDRAYIREALLEVQTSLNAIDCVYNNFVVNARFVSVVGPNACAGRIPEERDDKCSQPQKRNPFALELRL
jgi:hypothetical protein